jgi:hypothetical protein
MFHKSHYNVILIDNNPQMKHLSARNHSIMGQQRMNPIQTPP